MSPHPTTHTPRRRHPPRTATVRPFVIRNIDVVKYSPAVVRGYIEDIAGPQVNIDATNHPFIVSELAYEEITLAGFTVWILRLERYYCGNNGALPNRIWSSAITVERAYASALQRFR